MKTFRDIINEVAQPKSGDEQNFKDKHEIEMFDHPEAEETQFTSRARRARRVADYDEYEDEEVYEANYAKVTKKTDDGEGLDPVGAEDEDIDNDGDVDSSDRYLRNRRKVVKKAIKKSTMDEASVSKSQQRLMGMALAYKRGEMDEASDEVKKLAKDMSLKDLEDFAKTAHKGLPDKVNEDAWEEIPMMKRQLEFIKYAADEISDYLSMDIDPEEWFQNKLAHIHGQVRTLHAYIEGDKRVMDESLYEAKQPIAYRTFAMGADRVGKRLVQLGDDIKRIQDVGKEDVTGEMKAIKDEITGLVSSAKKLPMNPINEGTQIEEAIKVGNMKLNDGSVVSISKKDAELLNQMMGGLNAKNRKEMEKTLKADEDGFDSILGFAREAL